jgi:AraC-like DNA-binding protein
MPARRRGQSTIGTTQAADLLNALQSLGADIERLRASVGWSRQALQDPHARIATAGMLSVFEQAARELRDPLVGLHAGIRVQTRGVLFYLVFSSPRLSEGLRLLARFVRTSLDSEELTFSIGRGELSLTVEPGDPAVERSYHCVDYIMSATLGVLRRAVPNLELLAVELRHLEPADPGETARIFGCQVRFGCRSNVLRFSDTVLDSVPTAANPTIAVQIEKVAESLIAGVDAQRVADRVAHATRGLIGRGLRADRSAVARELRVSERTLQRQLAQESMTFSAVREAILTELSQALLSNRSLKVEAVALSVGFADLASFSKAFTRWVGCSPTGYRNGLGSRGASEHG